MRSRVVPGIAVTIAISAPASAFIRLDLPTFGAPTSTTFNPSRSSAPCRGLLQQLVKIGANARQPPGGVGLLQKIELFFREIERRFDQHAQLDQRRRQRVRALRKFAGQRAHRGARGDLGGRIDQVGDRFGLREIEPVVQETRAA